MKTSEEEPRKKGLEEDRLIEDSVKSLSRVLDKDKLSYFTFDKDKALYHSCKVIANKMGFELTRMDERELNIEQICALSNIQYRHVKLAPEWWKKDHGDFVGYHQEKKQYIPVLRSNKGKYYTFEGTNFHKVEITEGNASLIAPQAIVLYQPLPEECVGVRPLLKILYQKNEREYWLLGLTGILAIVLSFFFPIANKLFFDVIIPNYDFTAFYQVFLGLIIFTTSSSVFLFTRSIVLLRLNGRLSNRLQMSLWDRLLKLPVSFFRTMSTGDLLQRTLIFNKIRDVLSENTLKIIFNGVFSFLYLAIMFYFSWRLAIGGLILIVITSVLTFSIFIIRLYYERVILRSNAKINAFLIQAIRAIAKIRIANAESRIFIIWAKLFSENQALNYKSKNLKNIITTFNATFNLFIPLVIFAVVTISREADPSLFSVGKYLAFTAAFGPFTQATLQFLNTIASLVTIIPFWERIRPLLETPIVTTQNKMGLKNFEGDISIKNLHFRYGETSPLILKGLSFDVSPGEFIGIVGRSGSGKSTLCRLIIGFETPIEGGIYFDGKDLRDLNVYQVRKQVKFLVQSGGIITGTLFENLVCGGKYSADEIQKAIELSTFIDELQSLKMGLDTMISSGGGLLSGGQRQKLLLTRIFLQKPKVVVLDEALNSLDNKSRTQILDNLKKLQLTRIVTAHNLNTLINADRILVLDQGAIIDVGTFQELSNKEGLFKTFFEKQII